MEDESLDLLKELSVNKTEDSSRMCLSQTITEELSSASSPKIKTVKTNVSDTDKNRCAYITKKVVQLFLSNKFKGLVTRLCKQNKCSL